MISIDSWKVRLLLLPLLGAAALSCDAPGAATRGAPAAGDSAAADSARDAIACTLPDTLRPLPPQLPEASGIAVGSRRGEAWVHNDSEQRPALYRIDPQGSITQRVRLADIDIEDWEDIAAARCGRARCLYLADIGDNLHERPAVRIVRVREPAPRDTSVAADGVFPVRYPEGPADAEALFVLPGERIFIITKGRNRSITLYRYPGRLRPDTVTLEPVQTLSDGVTQFPDMVTGAEATLDGHHVAVRRYGYVELYHVRDGRLVRDARLDLRPLGERQGEGVALREDGVVLLVSERGPGGSPAAIAHARCMLP